MTKFNSTRHGHQTRVIFSLSIPLSGICRCAPAPRAVRTAHVHEPSSLPRQAHGPRCPAAPWHPRRGCVSHTQTPTTPDRHGRPPPSHRPLPGHRRSLKVGRKPAPRGKDRKTWWSRNTAKSGLVSPESGAPNKTIRRLAKLNYAFNSFSSLILSFLSVFRSFGVFFLVG